MHLMLISLASAPPGGERSERLSGKTSASAPKIVAPESETTARRYTPKAESGPLEIREPLSAPTLYPTAPMRRVADYTRVRIQPLRVLLRPKPMLSAHLFNFAKRSSGIRAAGTTGS